MKRSLSFVIKTSASVAIAALIFASFSCKKCVTCTAYEDANYLNSVISEEYCATGPNASKNVNDWEDAFRQGWAGFYVECVNSK